jgi:Spy/CpxP family protein refolding chaperone
MRHIGQQLLSIISIEIKVVCALILSLALAGVSTASDSSVAAVANSKLSHRHHVDGIEDRVAMLSNALNLDATQRQQVRQILQHQRELIRSVWNDTTTTSSYRVIATRAIGDQTSDQIRAMLNEEQLKKYNPPRSVHQTEVVNVEQWMSGKASQASAPQNDAARGK